MKYYYNYNSSDQVSTSFLIDEVLNTYIHVIFCFPQYKWLDATLSVNGNAFTAFYIVFIANGTRLFRVQVILLSVV